MRDDTTEQTAQYQEEVQAGAQSTLAMPAGSAGKGLTIFTGRIMHPERGYRITATGKNVLLTIRTGTSDRHQIERITPPARFVCYGNAAVFAKVVSNDLEAEARVMVGFARAGEVPDVAGQETGPVELQPSAVAVRALVDCTLTIGGVAVALAAGQAAELRQPASLDTGTATVLYEP